MGCNFANRQIYKRRLAILANKYDLDIHITGLSALPSFSFKTEDNLKYKTFITQEMLKKGYLAAMSVYVCTEHKEQRLYA